MSMTGTTSTTLKARNERRPNLLALTVWSFLFLFSSCPGCPDRLTVLSLNLRGIYNVPCSDGVPWNQRYGRIGPWLASNNVRPDVIALQEVSGWVWCPTNPDLEKDYQSLAFLIKSLRTSLNIEYRIAYFIGEEPGAGPNGLSHCGMEKGATTAGGCREYAGGALLYNPTTLTHISETELPSNGTAKRSLPCCNPRPSDKWVCSLIDGPLDDTKCTQTPTGIAFKGGDGELTRFRYQNDSSKVIHVYNFHWQLYEKNEESREGAMRFIRGMEDHFSADPRFIPPIVAGDFNRHNPCALPDRFIVVGPQFGIDGILVGRPAQFPAQRIVVPEASGVGPSGDNDKCHAKGILWSDHCGVYARLNIDAVAKQLTLEPIECPSDRTLCAGMCVDAKSDDLHCGCCTECAKNQKCEAGSCRCTCPAGTYCSDDGCTKVCPPDLPECPCNGDCMREELCCKFCNIECPKEEQRRP